MRTFLSMLSILLTTFTFGQNPKDTLISKHYLDSLHPELHNKETTKNGMSFRYPQKANLQRIDTTQFQDSIIVTHLSQEGKVLRLEKFLLNTRGCKTHQTDQYFDKQDRLIYVEYWSLACLDKEHNDPDIKQFTGIKTKYERLEYDNENRIKLRIFHDINIGTRRITYVYDNSGKQSFELKRIQEHEFWN